ncbi:hypothetical protein TrCOL_g8749, partial [Triparma columacea]
MHKFFQLIRTAGQTIFFLAQIRLTRFQNHRLILRRQTFHGPIRRHIFRRNFAGHRAIPNTAQGQHHVAFITRPIRRAVPQGQGFVQRFKQVLFRHRIKQFFRCRTNQRHAMFTRFGQQNGQIDINGRRFKNAGQNIVTLPFAKLQLTFRRITPRNNVIMHHDGHFHRTQNFAFTRARAGFQQIVNQRTTGGFIQTHGHGHQQ